MWSANLGRHLTGPDFTRSSASPVTGTDGEDGASPAFQESWFCR